MDGLRQATPGVNLVSATPVTAGCRMIQSAAELALMQRASDITIAAFKAAFATLREGMTPYDLENNILHRSIRSGLAASIARTSVSRTGCRIPPSAAATEYGLEVRARMVPPDRMINLRGGAADRVQRRGRVRCGRRAR